MVCLRLRAMDMDVSQEVSTGRKMQNQATPQQFLHDDDGGNQLGGGSQA